MRIDEHNQKLEEDELKHELPLEDAGLEPKWCFKVRWQSPSHTVRGKVLGTWNKRSRFVKFYRAEKANEIIIEFLVPKKIPFESLGAVTLSLTNTFAVALNVSTLGFFWWYLPAKTAELLGQIRDLERNVPLAADTPALNLVWGKRVLTDHELETTSRIYAHLQRLSQQNWAPYQAYLHGLALIGKSDILARFEPAILHSFYMAFAGLLKECGDWDGSSPFLEAALKSLAIFDDRAAVIERELPRVVELAQTATQESPSPDVTLRDGIVMKICCDMCITRLAHEALGFLPAKNVGKTGDAHRSDDGV